MKNLTGVLLLLVFMLLLVGCRQTEQNNSAVEAGLSGTNVTDDFSGEEGESDKSGSADTGAQNTSSNYYSDRQDTVLRFTLLNDSFSGQLDEGSVCMNGDTLCIRAGDGKNVYLYRCSLDGKILQREQYEFGEHIGPVLPTDSSMELDRSNDTVYIFHSESGEIKEYKITGERNYGDPVCLIDEKRVIFTENSDGFCQTITLMDLQSEMTRSVSLHDLGYADSVCRGFYPFDNSTAVVFLIQEDCEDVSDIFLLSLDTLSPSTASFTEVSTEQGTFLLTPCMLDGTDGQRAALHSTDVSKGWKAVVSEDHQYILVYPELSHTGDNAYLYKVDGTACWTALIRWDMEGPVSFCCLSDRSLYAVERFTNRLYKVELS